MSDDLVKRLRKGCIYDEAELSWCADVNEIDTDALCIEGADMIEELKARIEELEAKVTDKMLDNTVLKDLLWEKQNEN